VEQKYEIIYINKVLKFDYKKEKKRRNGGKEQFKYAKLLFRCHENFERWSLWDRLRLKIESPKLELKLKKSTKI